MGHRLKNPKYRRKIQDNKAINVDRNGNNYNYNGNGYCNEFSFRIEPILHAKVPILMCHERKSGLSVDISVLRCQEKTNNLINFYIEYDEIQTKMQNNYNEIKHGKNRLQSLIITIKHWVRQRGIAESRFGWPNSFAYIVMLINFLQHTMPYSFLPVVYFNNTRQSERVEQCMLKDDKSAIGNNISNGQFLINLARKYGLYYHTMPGVLSAGPNHMANSLSHFVLLMAFFEYVVNYDWKNYQMSIISTNNTIPKNPRQFNKFSGNCNLLF